MDLGEKDVRRISTLTLVLVLGILAFFVVQPLLIAVLSALILAYIFSPVYNKVLKYIPNKNAAATLVSVVILVVLFVPLWFMTPMILQQVYDIAGYYQKLDVGAVVQNMFPTSSEKFITQTTLTMNNLVNTLTSSISKYLIDFLLNIPFLLIDLLIVAFVFYYSLRDADKLGAFARSISPLSEANEQVLVKHFKDMTDTIIYGQFIVGIVQGLLAGIGFALFGVNNALVLTLLAIFFSVIPFIGPWVVWGPVNVYLFATGKPGLALGYLAYNVLIVSVVDNILRSYLISRKTNISPALVMVGMIGGIYLFNMIGILIGPLILAYFFTLLKTFKDKSFYSLFSK